MINGKKVLVFILYVISWFFIIVLASNGMIWQLVGAVIFNNFILSLFKDTKKWVIDEG